jgi:transcriptional regulator with XRE-family HTH domain
MKKKTKAELSPLSAAVRRVRDAYGDTQEQFARRLGVAVMTVSHFETGHSEPRHPRLLDALSALARHRNLESEGDLFAQASLASARVTVSSMFGALPPSIQIPQEWRLMYALKLTRNFFPEELPAIQKAAAKALAIIDEVLETTKANPFGDMVGLEEEIYSRALDLQWKEMKQRKDQNR